MVTLKRELTGIAVGLVISATALGQVTVNTPPANMANTPPANRVAPTHIQAGPVDVESGPAGTNVTIPPGTVAPLVERIRENAAIRQGERQAARNDWRMRNYNGQWWYWNPDNTWSVYRNNAWVPYGAASAPGGVSAAPATGLSSAPVGPSVARRGPLGLRRYSAGYRGYAPPTVAPYRAPSTTPPSTAAPSATTPAKTPSTTAHPTPNSPTPAIPPLNP